MFTFTCDPIVRMDLKPAESKWGLPEWTVGPLAVLLAAPVVYLLARAMMVSRNVAYLDDIDGTLMLLLRLHDGGSWRDLVRWLFEVHNEHRMVMSRLLHVASYELTGTVNFAVLGVIGNLFLCGLCALLIRTAGSAARRWVMAILLVGLLFQTQHFENFFWSGSSIDHFQVVFLSGAAFVLLARGGWVAWLGAGVFALLATFTLAHGLMVWPVGAVLLAADRRWRQLAAWVPLGAAAGAVFVADFSLNPAHHIGDFSVAGLAHMLRYWLELLGAPLALNRPGLAGIFGAALLALLGWQLKGGGFGRERITLPLALWAVAALALVALGRANLGDGIVSSRYFVLSGLAWALGIFAALHRRGDVVWTDHTLLWLVPGLVGFNHAGNLTSADAAQHWLDERDRAVADFVQNGRDGCGQATLHPLPQHATRVIREAERKGVFVMPRETEEHSFPSIQSGTKMSWAVDRVSVEDNQVLIDGWAALAGRMAKPGEVHVVLLSAGAQHILATSAVPRPDVAAAFPGEQWREAGFHFTMRRWLVPADNYQLGFLLRTERGSEMIITEQWVDLQSPLKMDRVAPNREVYDQLLLLTSKATVTAAPNKFMRVTFFDLHDCLVFVDFSGAGVMTIRLDGASSLSPAPRDGGRAVAHMKGAASISITGANESTNLGVSAARRQPLSYSGPETSQAFDGRAHLASISIASENGKFGAVRAGNVLFSATAGLTGIAAPGVRFSGPVNVGDIRASGTAEPKLELGFARDTRVAGGNLYQPNGLSVRVSGIWRLRFVEGRTSRGEVLPALANLARLEQDGQDVTQQIVEQRRWALGSLGDRLKLSRPPNAPGS